MVGDFLISNYYSFFFSSSFSSSVDCEVMLYYFIIIIDLLIVCTNTRHTANSFVGVQIFSHFSHSILFSTNKNVSSVQLFN